MKTKAPLRLKQRMESRYNIKLDKESREVKYTHLRSIFYRLCRDNWNMTLTEIADMLGKNHVTVIHGIYNVFPKAMDTLDYRTFYAKNLESSVVIADTSEDRVRLIKEQVVLLRQELKELI